jgi:predicted site-specific integrase-resolvase
MTEPQLFGSTEACDRLGISRSALTQWMAKGWIVPVEPEPVGASYVFTATEVERAGAAHPREQAKAAEATA